MKIRSNFVSNSSSSSFIIGKRKLTKFQIELIKNHLAVSKEYNMKLNGDCSYEPSEYDEWQITETEDYIKGYTSMDNFNMEGYLKEIGVLVVEWDDYCL